MRFLDRSIQDSGEVSDEKDDLFIDNITAPDKLPYHLIDATKGRKMIRKYKSVRLSEVDKSCAREYILGNRLNISYEDFARFSNLWQMDMGSMMHWFIQNSSKYFGDRVVGWWRCRACGFTRRFGVMPKEPCENCHAHPRTTEYKEYMFRLTTPFHVVGKIDLMLRVAPRVYRFGEIKTCSEDKTSPDGDHVAQLASYTYFSRFDEQLPITIDRSKSYLFYFNKKFNWNSPVKVFTIQPTEALMAPIIDKMRIITEGINTGQLVDPLAKCVSSKWLKGRAKSCGSAKECQKYFEEKRMVV